MNERRTESHRLFHQEMGRSGIDYNQYIEYNNKGKEDLRQR